MKEPRGGQGALPKYWRGHQHVMGYLSAYLFGQSRSRKRVLQWAADFGLVALSLTTVIVLHSSMDLAVATVLSVGCAAGLVAFLHAARFYHAIVRYISYRSFAFGALLCLVVVSFLEGCIWLLTREVLTWRFVADGTLLAILSLGLPRLALRGLFLATFGENYQRVLIYGAGAAGRQLLKILRASEAYHCVGFIDDDKDLVNAHVDGQRVWSGHDLNRCFASTHADTVLLAMPTVTRQRRSEVIQRLEPFEVAVKTVPSLESLITHRADLAQFDDVPVEDLLGRDPVVAQRELIEHDVRNRVVLVTGAGGSIGSELVRQVLRQQPSQLILVERSEYALYTIEVECLRILAEAQAEHSCPVTAVLGDVCDEVLLFNTMKTYKVETVYHAAAYKHVPLVEANALAGVINNVRGTYATAYSALKAGIESFVLISTDKAVRPTNVMGASKRWSELCVQALARTASRTRFSIVRFGNVLGSSGSVIPRFRQQIREGGPVTVTHPEMIRYFMTIPEAAQLVVQAGAQGGNGDVFVLDMGTPVKILDLAERLVRLSGHTVKTAERPHGDIEITITGLRPGEKLYEELLVSGNEEHTRHPRICRAQEPSISLKDLQLSLEKLDSFWLSRDGSGLIEYMAKGLPLSFTPGSTEQPKVGHSPDAQDNLQSVVTV